MHSLLAKPLDWVVIQLASRSVRCRAGHSAHAEEARALLEAPELFPRIVPAPAAVRFRGRTTFVFDSPVATPFAANNRVHGKLYRAAADWQNRPTVILLHGWNAEWGYRRLFPQVALQFRRAQVNAAMIELPYHAHRKPRGMGVVRNFISEDLARMVEATSQAVADARALVQWLKLQGSPAVGVWGFSLGGWLAGLVACTERNLDAAVLATPVVNLERVIAELPFCAPIRRSLAETSISLARLSLLSRQPQIKSRAVLLLESVHDLFVPPATIEELWQTWRKPEIWRVPHGHISIWLAPHLLSRVARWMVTTLNEVT